MTHFARRLAAVVLFLAALPVAALVFVFGDLFAKFAPQWAPGLAVAGGVMICASPAVAFLLIRAALRLERRR